MSFWSFILFDKLDYLFKVSGFTGNATVVGSNVQLYCGHSSFKESTSGISITLNGNSLAWCLNQQCYNGTSKYA